MTIEKYWSEPNKEADEILIAKVEITRRPRERYLDGWYTWQEAESNRFLPGHINQVRTHRVPIETYYCDIQDLSDVKREKYNRHEIRIAWVGDLRDVFADPLAELSRTQADLQFYKQELRERNDMLKQWAKVFDSLTDSWFNRLIFLFLGARYEK